VLGQFSTHVFQWSVHTGVCECQIVNWRSVQFMCCEQAFTNRPRTEPATTQECQLDNAGWALYSRAVYILLDAVICHVQPGVRTLPCAAATRTC